MTLTAIIFLLAEALVLGLLHRVVRAFGAYTEAFVKAHNEDRIVKQQIIKVLEYMEELLRKENAA